jgi:O-antigen/teichoic acid export membrane protein
MIEKIKELLRIPSIRYTYMSIIASVLNFITLIAWGRIFLVGDYGIATTLQAFVTNAATFVIPLQVIACTLLAGNSENRKRDITSIMKVFGFINIIELGLLVVCIDKLMQYFHFTGVVEIVLFSTLIFLNNIYTISIGFAQGEQDFELLGKIGISLYLMKLIISVILGNFGVGFVATMIGFVIAETVCVVLMLRKLSRSIRISLNENKTQVNKSILKQYVWILLLNLILSLYMNNGDLLLGNLYCSETEVGAYSVTIALSKISVFLVSTPIATIILPKMATAKDEKRKCNTLLILAETITLGMSVLYGGCFYIFGGWIIPFLYGESYRGATEYILPCTFFSVVLGVFWVFYQYILATDLTKIFALATAVTGVMAIAWILVMKVEIGGIPFIMAIAMILTMVVLAIYLNSNVRI